MPNIASSSSSPQNGCVATRSIRSVRVIAPALGWVTAARTMRPIHS